MLSNVVPGDTIQRSVDLVNNGTGQLGQPVLHRAHDDRIPELAAGHRSNQRPADDHRKCSVAWTESASPYTYTCCRNDHRRCSPLAPSSASNMPLTGLSSLTTGSTDHLRVTLTLPTAAREHDAGTHLNDLLQLPRHAARRREQVGNHCHDPAPHTPRAAPGVRSWQARRGGPQRPSAPAGVGSGERCIGFAHHLLRRDRRAPGLGIYRPVTVLSGSMRPTFSPGDVVIDVPEPISAVRVGQVVSYHVPVGIHQVETHRVVSITGPASEPTIQTRGDANNAQRPVDRQARRHDRLAPGGCDPQARLPASTPCAPHAPPLAVIIAPALLAILLIARYRGAAPPAAPSPTPSPREPVEHRRARDGRRGCMRTGRASGGHRPRGPVRRAAGDAGVCAVGVRDLHPHRHWRAAERQLGDRERAHETDIDPGRLQSRKKHRSDHVILYWTASAQATSYAVERASASSRPIHGDRRRTKSGVLSYSDSPHDPIADHVLLPRGRPRRNVEQDLGDAHGQNRTRRKLLERRALRLPARAGAVAIAEAANRLNRCA